MQPKWNLARALIAPANLCGIIALRRLRKCTKELWRDHEETPQVSMRGRECGEMPSTLTGIPKADPRLLIPMPLEPSAQAALEFYRPTSPIGRATRLGLRVALAHRTT